MSLSIGTVNATQNIASVGSVNASTSGGGLLPFSTGATAAGGYIAQGSGAPTGGSSLVKKMLAGAVVGAGVGFAASFINPVVALVTSFGPAGWAAKGIIVAAGAAIGAAGGAIAHFISKRKQNLAMQAQAQATQQDAMVPAPVPKGVTLRANARGGYARKLQEDLTALGLYKGKATRMFDRATQEAVKKYEVMKGVQPTGQATPELRAAVSQDVQLIRQYA